MKIFYRISNNSYNKDKFDFATKEFCLNNFIKEFGSLDINLIVDNFNQKSYNIIEGIIFNSIISTNLGNAKSFKYIFNQSIELDDNEIILFQEDDYLHLPGSKQCYLEGIEISDYVSLYDHPDKYNSGSKGGNPQIEDDGGEKTKVYLTKSTHWKRTNSTTMTFAARVKTLKEDKDIWYKYIQGNHPEDYQAFCELIQTKNRKLITPIPCKSTHVETGLPSPLRNCIIKDWNELQ